MLEHFAYHFENFSSQDLTHFIERLLEKPLPAPGEALEVDLSNNNNNYNNNNNNNNNNSLNTLNKWRFIRPNEEDSLFEHVFNFIFYFFNLFY